MIGWLAARFIRTLHATLHIRHIRVANIEAQPQCIVAFWHSHLLLIMYCRYKLPMTAMISRSKDGALIADTLSHWGVDAARGSTTRGGSAALREMLRAAQKGGSIAFTPDGPTGPPRIAKDGVIYAAQATSLPIIPVAFAAKKKSYCGRGTGWSSRCRSAGPFFSTARRSSFRGTGTWRNGANTSSAS